MHTDCKIGAVVGLVLVSVTAIYLATRPILSVKSRRLPDATSNRLSEHSNRNVAEKIQKPRFITDLPGRENPNTPNPP